MIFSDIDKLILLCKKKKEKKKENTIEGWRNVTTSVEV